MEQVATARGAIAGEVPDAAPTAEELWTRHGKAVCRFASMVARDDQEADDIAQESLLRAIRALPRFKPRAGGVEAWLWRIVQNTARDFGRAARRRKLLLERLAQLADRGNHRWPELEREIDGRALVEAVRALPATQRNLIALRFGADLDYASVGRLTGLSPLAARAATRRALDALRRDLAPRSGRA
jgi:RNA polymerase sigma-70 factor (ECF subfamily)